MYRCVQEYVRVCFTASFAPFVFHAPPSCRQSIRGLLCTNTVSHGACTRFLAGSTSARQRPSSFPQPPQHLPLGLLRICPSVFKTPSYHAGQTRVSAFWLGLTAVPASSERFVLSPENWARAPLCREWAASPPVWTFNQAADWAADCLLP